MLLALVVLLGVPTAWVMARDTDVVADTGVVEVKRGEFLVTVTTSGELRAPKSVQITGPTDAQQAGVYQMKIQSLIPEGTIVKAGDVVAELDRSTVANQMQEVSLAMQKAQAQFQQALLDTTLTLSQAREDLRNMELALEEKNIAKEQAQYEAPSVRRQADLDLDKATRGLAKAKIDYKTKGEQARAKMSEVGADLARQQNRLNAVQAVMAAFTIRSPGPGMLIYVKEWNGRKKGAGSQITPWDPIVATLPDLTEMESITYVNEIDVRKLAVGQTVSIALDADPTKKLVGKVVQVANVGEQRPNADSKVFEVRVNVEKPDTTLRPGMTTSNAVATHTIKNALFIPIEAVHSDSSVAFVYKRDGARLVRQEVETGAMNDDEIVIARGLTDSDRVLLAPPVDGMSLPLVALDGRSKPKVGGDTSNKAPVEVKTKADSTRTDSSKPSAIRN
jgi:multidrug efflux pump subunit AcrA (membrane-fusion protein)